MARVLVTGGAGYIGSHAVSVLVEKGHEVTILDNFSTGHRTLVHPKSQVIEGDVRDEERVLHSLRQNQIEAVLHFAALTSVEESIQKPEKYYDNNFTGTVRLLKACESAGVKKMIFSSTAAVYAASGMEPVNEQSKLDPGTPYGKSKLMAEQALQDLASAGRLQYVILRYFNVGGASRSNRLGLIGDDHPSLVKRAALAAVGKIKELPIYGVDYPTKDGTAIRDFIYVEDLVEIHVQALDALLSGAPSDVFNCGYGTGFSVRQVTETMKRISQKDFCVRELPRRAGDLACVIAENSKLVRTFGLKSEAGKLDLICQTAFDWEKKLKGS